MPCGTVELLQTFHFLLSRLQCRQTASADNCQWRRRLLPTVSSLSQWQMFAFASCQTACHRYGSNAPTESTVKINCACPEKHKQNKTRKPKQKQNERAAWILLQDIWGGEQSEKFVQYICIYIFISLYTPPKIVNMDQYCEGEFHFFFFCFLNMTLSLRLCHKHKTQRIVA